MTRRFAIGFLNGFLVFPLINLLAAHLASDCGLLAVFGRDSCADDIVRAGWPLHFYEEGGFAYRSNFNILYLVLNIAIGFAFSILPGWVCSRNKKTLSK